MLHPNQRRNPPHRCHTEDQQKDIHSPAVDVSRRLGRLFGAVLSSLQSCGVQSRLQPWEKRLLWGWLFCVFLPGTCRTWVSGRWGRWERNAVDAFDQREGQLDFALRYADSHALLVARQNLHIVINGAVPQLHFGCEQRADGQEDPDDNQVEASQSGVRLRIRSSLWPPSRRGVNSNCGLIEIGRASRR